MLRKNSRLSAMLFIAPHLTLFTVFILLPSIFGVYVSFTRWNLLSDPTWVGLDNYRTILFNEDSTFYMQLFNGLKNTFIFVGITVPLMIIVPLTIAVILEHKDVKWKDFFQSIIFIPGLISVSASALIWSLIFNKQLGIVGNVFGSEPVWTATQPYAWITIIILTIWGGIGGNMIIYRASINGVPKELYESADIDGAGSFRKFISVTLPSIRFPLIYTLVMSTAGAFNVFGQPLMMTDGGPMQSTTVLMMYIRDLAFGSGESIAGIASAMAVLLGVAILIVSAVQYYLLTRNS